MTIITYDILKYRGKKRTRTVTVTDQDPSGRQAIRILSENNALKIGAEYAGCIVKKIIMICPNKDTTQ